MIQILNKIIKKIFKEINLLLPTNANNQEIASVFKFYNEYQDFRSLKTCSKQTKISINKCARIKKKLYKYRKLGSYYFQAAVPPQKFMLNYVLKNNDEINYISKILEIGPGEYPIFPFNDYINWIGIDKYLNNNTIEFKDNEWAKNQYPKEKIFKGEFKHLTKINSLKNLIGNFDLVIGSHSYEHSTQPIQALKESAKMLKSGGKFIIFVPNGYSDDINTKDPTHTIYINPKMMKEFFNASKGFKNITIKDYRPNLDLVITAEKI